MVQMILTNGFSRFLSINNHVSTVKKKNPYTLRECQIWGSMVSCLFELSLKKGQIFQVVERLRVRWHYYDGFIDYTKAFDCGSQQSVERS